MSTPTSRPATGSVFPSDQKGRLYDPAFREAIAKGGSQAGHPAIEAAAAVRLAAKRMHMAIERWAESHGLTEGRLRILMTLLHAEENRMALGDLAERLNVAPRTMTGLVDTLERDGLVVRVPDPSDRRSLHAQLTPAGKDRIQTIWQDAIRQQTQFGEGWALDELAILRHLCLRLVESLSVLGLTGGPEGGQAD